MSTIPTWDYVCGRNSQHGEIIRYMSLHPLEFFTALDFMDYSAPHFVGYKAGTRLSELQKQGVLIGRWSERCTTIGKPYMEYRLNLGRYKFKIDVPRREIYRAVVGPYNEQQIRRKYGKANYLLSS